MFSDAGWWPLLCFCFHFHMATARYDVNQQHLLIAPKHLRWRGTSTLLSLPVAPFKNFPNIKASDHYLTLDNIPKDPTNTTIRTPQIHQHGSTTRFVLNSLHSPPCAAPSQQK